MALNTAICCIGNFNCPPKEHSTSIGRTVWMQCSDAEACTELNLRRNYKKCYRLLHHFVFWNSLHLAIKQRCFCSSVPFPSDVQDISIFFEREIESFVDIPPHSLFSSLPRNPTSTCHLLVAVSWWCHTAEPLIALYWDALFGKHWGIPA